MKRWRLSFFPGITYSGVSCSCIGRLVPGASQPLFLLSPLMYQRLGQLATSGKRLQQLCDIYIYMAVTRIFEHIPATSCDPAEHERMYWGRAGIELEDHGDFIDFPHPACFRSFQHSMFAACRALKHL